MTADELIDDSEPLETDFIPSNFIGRDTEQTQLAQYLSGESRQNVVLQGPPGTGKTHLLRHHLETLPERVTTCYIPCRQYDTQYKALTRLYEAVTNEQINSGHHTADLHREIENRTSAVPSIVVLDDVEFLLLKDGDDLLYKLSRTNPQQVTLALPTARPDQLNTDLEERTQSSLQTRTMQFEQYSGQQLYDILAHRARESLQPRSLRQDALTYIASTTSHSSFALTWLKTAAKHTDDHITETTVKQTQESAYNTFIETQLQDFTPHHRLLYQAITELEKEVDSPVHTGQVNQRYRDLSQVQNENQMSNRQLSTYLKQLDLLDLIQTKYYYGGQKGKTREIILNTPGHL